MPAGTSHFALIFTPETLKTYSEYEVLFVDPEGREALRVDELVLSDSSGLRLGLPRGLLPEAEYRILLNGFDVDLDRWQPVEEYRRRIVYLGAS